MKLLALSAVLLFNLCLINASVDQSCLNCICEASTGCQPHPCVTVKGHQLSNCGPFKLSTRHYGQFARKGSDFETCANTKSCAQQVVANWLSSNVVDCNGDGLYTCLDYALSYKYGAKCVNKDVYENDEYYNNYLSTSCAQPAHVSGQVPGSSQVAVDERKKEVVEQVEPNGEEIVVKEEEKSKQVDVQDETNNGNEYKEEKNVVQTIREEDSPVNEPDTVQENNYNEEPARPLVKTQQVISSYTPNTKVVTEKKTVVEVPEKTVYRKIQPKKIQTTVNEQPRKVLTLHPTYSSVEKKVITQPQKVYIKNEPVKTVIQRFVPNYQNHYYVPTRPKPKYHSQHNVQTSYVTTKSLVPVPVPVPAPAPAPAPVPAPVPVPVPVPVKVPQVSVVYKPRPVQQHHVQYLVTPQVQHHYVQNYDVPSKVGQVHQYSSVQLQQPHVQVPQPQVQVQQPYVHVQQPHVQVQQPHLQFQQPQVQVQTQYYPTKKNWYNTQDVTSGLSDYPLSNQYEEQNDQGSYQSSLVEETPSINVQTDVQQRENY